MPTIELTDDYLLLLDGRVDAATQAEIDAAKHRKSLNAQLGALPPKVAEFVTNAVAEARKSGILIWQSASTNYCGLCGKVGGYAKYKRNGRYHRKGQSDHTKPLSFNGIELKESFVRIQNHISLGGCTACVESSVEHLRTALKDVAAELPEKLASGSRYKRWDRRRCDECGWTGHEGQLGMLPAWMGGGRYRGECPSCGAKNELLSSKVKRVEGFELVAVTN